MKIKISVIVFLAVLLNFSGDLIAQNTNPDLLFDRAAALRATGSADSSILLFQKAAKGYLTIRSYEKAVNSLNQSGALLTRQDKYDPALTDLNLALKTGQKYLDKNNLTLASTFVALGVIFNARKEYEQSLSVHHKALNIRLTKSGRVNADVATSYGNIGNVYFNDGQIDKAIENHSEALRIRKELFGEDGSELVQSYVNLGKSLLENKMYQGALGSYQSAMKIRLKQTGPTPKDLPKIYKSISDIYYLMGNDKEGEAFKIKSEKPL
jgi:tetratricopeptide (TPR) repeat protein